MIGAYIADDLAVARRRAFEAHLSGCPDCAAFLATYKRTIDLTRDFLASGAFETAPVELKRRLPSRR